jgi:F0F1-type ATP synthase assembly protein I
MTEAHQKSAFWQALSMAWELGYVIAIPLVALALLGRYLDNKLNTSPWLLLTGIILSIVISSIGLVWKFNKIIGKIDKNNEKPKT